jgi:hypothetical protein
MRISFVRYSITHKIYSLSGGILAVNAAQGTRDCFLNFADIYETIKDITI